MCPHVVGKGAGQSVVGDLLQSVRDVGVAEGRQRHLQREHRLHYGAQLCAMAWVDTRQVLVAREHPVGQAVVGVQQHHLP